MKLGLKPFFLTTLLSIMISIFMVSCPGQFAATAMGWVAPSGVPLYISNNFINSWAEIYGENINDANSGRYYISIIFLNDSNYFFDLDSESSSRSDSDRSKPYTVGGEYLSIHLAIPSQGCAASGDQSCTTTSNSLNLLTSVPVTSESVTLSISTNVGSELSEPKGPIPYTGTALTLPNSPSVEFTDFTVQDLGNGYYELLSAAGTVYAEFSSSEYLDITFTY